MPKIRIYSGSALTLLGIVLAAAGAFVAITSYYVLDFVPITALGFSAMILAAVSFALGLGPKIPADVSSMLLESGLENTAALIEELGTRSKAVYLPASMAAGKPRALIPVPVQPGSLKIDQKLPDRLIVRYGKEPESMGILISTLGSTVLERRSQDLEGSDLESALSLTLKGSDLADGVRSVEAGGDKNRGNIVRVQVTNSRIVCRKMKVFENIGSPLASVVASVASQAMNAPVTIVGEETSGNRHLITLSIESANIPTEQ